MEGTMQQWVWCSNSYLGILSIIF